MPEYDFLLCRSIGGVGIGKVIPPVTVSNVELR